MARTFTMILALAALLSLAACNTVTGPTAGSLDTIDRTGDRTPGELQNPDELTPEGEGGGGGLDREPTYNDNGRPRRGQEHAPAGDGIGTGVQSPDELAPEGEGGGGTNDREPTYNERPRRSRGQEHTP